MDHQVEHHVDVRAAFAKRRQPVAFNEARRAQQRLDSNDGGVEALQVADLQHPPRLARRPDELLRLQHGFGDGLFHQHVRARFKEGPGHLEMRGRRRHDADGIDPPERLAVIPEVARAEFRRERGSGLLECVDDGDERAVR